MTLGGDPLSARRYRKPPPTELAILTKIVRCDHDAVFEFDAQDRRSSYGGRLGVGLRV